MNNSKHSSDFDFDHWAKMAKQDPNQFEEMRQQMIRDVIDHAPEHIKPRIIGLQWQLDQIRNQADNPMAACLEISQKMWKKVYGEKGLLDALQEPEKILRSLNNDNNDRNKVISINKYKSTNN